MGMFDFSQYSRLRDRIAIAAMRELMRRYPDANEDVIAGGAYAQADSMMFARITVPKDDTRSERQRLYTALGYDDDNPHKEEHTASTVAKPE